MNIMQMQLMTFIKWLPYDPFEEKHNTIIEMWFQSSSPAFLNKVMMIDKQPLWILLNTPFSHPPHLLLKLFNA